MEVEKTTGAADTVAEMLRISGKVGQMLVTYIINQVGQGGVTPILV